MGTEELWAFSSKCTKEGFRVAGEAPGLAAVFSCTDSPSGLLARSRVRRSPEMSPQAPVNRKALLSPTVPYRICLFLIERARVGQMAAAKALWNPEPQAIFRDPVIPLAVFTLMHYNLPFPHTFPSSNILSRIPETTLTPLSAGLAQSSQFSHWKQ